LFEGTRDVSMRGQAPLVDMTGGITLKKDEVGGEAANLVLNNHTTPRHVERSEA